jgi:hypothetical protein
MRPTRCARPRRPRSSDPLTTLTSNPFRGASLNRQYWGAARAVATRANVTTDEVMASLLQQIALDDPASPTAYGNNAFAGFAAASAYYGVALHACVSSRAPACRPQQAILTAPP